MTKYYETQHWKIITTLYDNSDLSKLCYKCRKSNKPYQYKHRTKTRIGNEKLTDIMPICQSCSLLDSKPQRSKKKIERLQLSAFGFNPDKISNDQKNWIMSIKPYLRGHMLSKYFVKKAQDYHPSNQWINNQVRKTCKWIKRHKKEMLEIV